MYLPIERPDPISQFYDLNSPASPSTTSLATNISAEVAIVGAGYTGLSTALHLAERGVDVVVLDAFDIGSGASGRAFGQVVPYSKTEHSGLLQHFGAGIGARLIDLVAEGPDLVFDLIARHKIECGALRTGIIFAAQSPAGLERLRRRSAYWLSRGAPVEMHDPIATAKLTGSPVFLGCMLERRGGTLNPLAYARGLGRTAIAFGTRIFSYSRVMQIEKSTSKWVIKTPRGQVSARQIVLATGAYTDKLWPGLRQSFLAVRGNQLVSRPLPPEIAASILPGKQSLTDTRRLGSGVRRYDNGCIHVTATGPYLHPTKSANVSHTMKRVLGTFPQLKKVEWEHQWTGWMDMTEDNYPRIHELQPDLFAILGYSARGIALATVLGRELSFKLARGNSEAATFPVTPLRAIRTGALTAPLAAALIGYKRIRDDIETARYLSPRL
jgi:glycine/D-amino acid oxidase-like deaminating enzyme